jgi:aryl-alcohol dehydrogenase
MRQIQAAVARSADSEFALEQLQLDEPRPDELVVRVAAVGICHSDIFVKQAMPAVLPAVLGHEGAGVVEAVGSAVTSVKPGDRVALTFRSCGHCTRCVAGAPAYCTQFSKLNMSCSRTDGSQCLHRDGQAISSNFFGQSSFANFALAYESNTVPIPDDLPFELAAPLGCGVQTGSGAVMNSFACAPGTSLVVMGGGTVGLSAVMAAAVQGCGKVILIEPLPARRKLALQIGATHVIDPRSQDWLAAIRSIEPQGVDYVLDTAGRTEMVTAVVGVLATRGVVGLVAPGGALGVEIIQLVMLGATIRGIIEGDSRPHEFIPRLIDLYKRGRFPVDRLVKTYPMGQINRAVAEQAAGTCVKPVLLP